ncbi:MAG: helix-turn-helix domain-containing protein [Mycobacterium sp.]
MPHEFEPLMTLDEVADVLRCDRRTVLKLIHIGSLQAIEITKGERPHRRVSQEALRAYLYPPA